MPALSVGFAKQGSSRGSTHVVALPCSSHALFLPPPFFLVGGEVEPPRGFVLRLEMAFPIHQLL